MLYIFIVVKGDIKMDAELLRELGLIDETNLSAIEYAERCIALYEQTLKSMGIILPESISQTVDNSKLTYSNPPDIGGQYANVPEHY
jgi:hypothetical protein